MPRALCSYIVSTLPRPADCLVYLSTLSLALRWQRSFIDFLTLDGEVQQFVRIRNFTREECFAVYEHFSELC